MDDRRRFPRIDDRSRVRWRSLDNDAPSLRDGMAINISGGGLCFDVDAPVPLGTLLALELRLPELPSDVIAMGKVVWCTPAKGRHELGVEFHWIGWDSTVAQQQIAGYIRQRLDKG